MFALTIFALPSIAKSALLLYLSVSITELKDSASPLTSPGISTMAKLVSLGPLRVICRVELLSLLVESSVAVRLRRLGDIMDDMGFEKMTS